MAKLYFNYGVMGSSKSANALMTHFNYKERGQNPLMVKPRKDTRDSEKVVSSRIGLRCPCIYFDELRRFNVEDIKSYDAIIVDEVQFLSESDVDFLVHIVDDLDVPVVCYGLRTDFKGELFTGSKRLFEMADRINEVKTVCWCGRKAIMNARFDNTGKVLKDGEQIQIGANECYTDLCRKHWREGNLGIKLNIPEEPVVEIEIIEESKEIEESFINEPDGTIENIVEEPIEVEDTIEIEEEVEEEIVDVTVPVIPVVEPNYTFMQRVILGIPSCFNLDDLYIIFRDQYNIVNRTRIKNSLDELCKYGVVKNVQVSNYERAFKVVR